MYFVPDGTKLCGLYECMSEKCHHMRFLDVRVAPTLVCPYCGEMPDMEIGPDEEMPEIVESAKLLDVIRGDDVEMMDALVSCALREDDESWL